MMGINLFSVNKPAFSIRYFFPFQFQQHVFRTVSPSIVQQVDVRTNFLPEETQDPKHVLPYVWL